MIGPSLPYRVEWVSVDAAFSFRRRHSEPPGERDREMMIGLDTCEMTTVGMLNLADRLSDLGQARVLLAETLEVAAGGRELPASGIGSVAWAQENAEHCAARLQAAIVLAARAEDDDEENGS